MKKFSFIFIICIFLMMDISISGNLGTTPTTVNSTTKGFADYTILSTSKTYPQHVEPTMVIGPNNMLFVGWKNAQTSYGNGITVSFTSSVDGKNWTNPITMPSNHSSIWDQSDPWLQYANKTLYYSYLDYYSMTDSGSVSQVTMAKSTNNGSTWTTTRASHNLGFADKETFIVSPQGTIYLTYDDLLNTTNGQVGFVKLAKSSDNGQTFSNMSIINNANNTIIIAPYPALSSNNTLFVAWTYYNGTNYYGNVVYDHSNNGGLNFTNNTFLNPEYYLNATSVYYETSTFPVIKFDSKDRLYALWDENENNSLMTIYLRYTDDFGLHWSNPIQIDQRPNTKQWEPDFAIDSNNNLHIAWLEQNNSQFRPYYRELSFTGTNRSTVNMGPIMPITNANTSAKFYRPGDYLTIRVDSNNIPHVVWTDGRSGSLDILYSYLTNVTISTSTTSLKSGGKNSPGFMVIAVLLTIPIYTIFKRKKH